VTLTNIITLNNSLLESKLHQIIIIIPNKWKSIKEKAILTLMNITTIIIILWSLGLRHCWFTISTFIRVLPIMSLVTADYYYTEWGCLVDFFKSGVKKLLARRGIEFTTFYHRSQWSALPFLWPLRHGYPFWWRFCWLSGSPWLRGHRHLTENWYLRFWVQSPANLASNFSTPDCKKVNLVPLSQGNSNLQWP